ncbi:secreted protein, partial [mine drainage metagenome]
LKRLEGHGGCLRLATPPTASSSAAWNTSRRTPETNVSCPNSTGPWPSSRSFPYTPNLWKAQNLYFELLTKVYPSVKERAQRGDPEAATWERGFLDLGRQLSVRVD